MSKAHLQRLHDEPQQLRSVLSTPDDDADIGSVSKATAATTYTTSDSELGAQRDTFPFREELDESLLGGVHAEDAVLPVDDSGREVQKANDQPREEALRHDLQVVVSRKF